MKQSERSLQYEQDAYDRFINNIDPLTYVESVTRSRCGYKALRMGKEKGEAMFRKCFQQVREGNRGNDRLLSKPSRDEHKHGVTNRPSRKEAKAKINQNGIDQLNNLFGR